MIRKEVMRKFCVNCECRTKLNRQEELEFAASGRHAYEIKCFGDSTKGVQLVNMNLDRCPMIDAVAKYMKQYDIKELEDRIKNYDDQIKELNIKKLNCKKEIEELKKS